MPSDILDDLLAEALRIELRNRRGSGSVKRLKEIQRICTQSLHAAGAWKHSRFVLVLHNEIGQLGYFEELSHRSGLARQLHRLDSEPDHYEIEVVTGPEWTGGPRVHLVDPPTETEVTRIRAYWKPKVVKFPWKHLRGSRRFGPLHQTSRSADEILKDLCA